MIATLHLEEGSDAYLVGDCGQDSSAPSWGSPDAISDELQDGYGIITEAQIAMDAGGSAIAAWIEQNRADSPEEIIVGPGILLARRFNGEVWSAAELFEGLTTDNGRRQIVMDGQGNAMAVFGSMDIWARRFDGSTWALDDLLTTEPAERTIWQIRP